MNSRPLLAITDNPEDENLLTLTPQHLKTARPLMVLPSSLDKIDVDKISNAKLINRWEQRKLLQKQFFVRFVDEYLGNLKARMTRQNQYQQLKRGDLVLIMNDRRSKHGDWPIARIEQVLPSSDGIIRSAVLKLPLKTKITKRGLHVDTTAKYTRRGVENLALLEASSGTSPQELDHDGRSQTTEHIGMSQSQQQ